MKQIIAPTKVYSEFGRFFIRDSTQFYRVALGSLNEIKSDLYLCVDREYLAEEELPSYLTQLAVVEKLTIGLIGSAQKVKRQR
ncbi:MAG: four helix bundle protein [Candidatus Blackburnbacteria bacterium]|nr:four helix bundle protein [Candidatus Blackburnbacteria bacterium]